MDYPPRKSSGKVFEVVRQFQILRKWKKLPPSFGTHSSSLRRAASFPLDEKAPAVVPKGCFVVSVGEVRKRFVVPTRFLAHPLFGELLREAEEEFGFQQKGVLRIPCDVFVFEHILRLMKGKKKKKGKNWGSSDSKTMITIRGRQVWSTFCRRTARQTQHLSIARDLLSTNVKL